MANFSTWIRNKALPDGESGSPSMKFVAVFTFIVITTLFNVFLFALMSFCSVALANRLKSRADDAEEMVIVQLYTYLRSLGFLGFRMIIWIFVISFTAFAMDAGESIPDSVVLVVYFLIGAPVICYLVTVVFNLWRFSRNQPPFTHLLAPLTATLGFLLRQITSLLCFIFTQFKRS